LIAISAIMNGRRATGSLGIKDDILNAGGTWVDDPALREGNLVWGRVVADIPDFCRVLVQALTEKVDVGIRGDSRSNLLKTPSSAALMGFDL
jgi:protease I